MVNAHTNTNNLGLHMCLCITRFRVWVKLSLTHLKLLHTIASKSVPHQICYCLISIFTSHAAAFDVWDCFINDISLVILDAISTRCFSFSGCKPYQVETQFLASHLTCLPITDPGTGAKHTMALLTQAKYSKYTWCIYFTQRMLEYWNLLCFVLFWLIPWYIVSFAEWDLNCQMSCICASLQPN